MRRIGLALLALVLTGCSAAVSGTAAPTTAAPSSIALPPRPREVSTIGVDPCALLTPAQRGQLGLNRPAIPSSGREQLYNGGEVRACSIRGNRSRAFGVGIALPSAGGVEVFTSGELDARITPITVQGFPAVEAIPSRFTEYCSVIVDVADHLALDVQYRDGGDKPPIPQDDLCAGARRAADLTMQTLLSLR